MGARVASIDVRGVSSVIYMGGVNEWYLRHG